MTAKQRRQKQGVKIIVIPARMDSSRLPGKPMLKTGGKPLVQWTYEQAKMTKADRVVVATGDEEIAKHCQRVGMDWMFTSERHQNGTSRASEVIAKLKTEIQQCISVVVNWQVDEPMLNPADVDKLMVMRVSSIGTLVCVNSGSTALLYNPNVTKVVWSRERCHWFSRAPMRGAGFHVGLYSFTPFLLEVVNLLEPSHLSIVESLEQLTWIENGFNLSPVEIQQRPLSIDTPLDWAEFERLKEAEEEQR